MDVFRKIDSRLKLKSPLNGVRLLASEAFLPDGYYVQMQPEYVRATNFSHLPAEALAIYHDGVLAQSK